MAHQQLALAGAPPLGKLEGTVTPLAYRLELTVQPEQARFRGHVEIDVQVKGGERAAFLHGRGLHVTRGRGTLPLARVIEDVRNCATLQSARSAELRAGFPVLPVHQELDSTRR